MALEVTTLLLRAAREGAPRAADDLLPHVYAELRRLAQSRVSQEPGVVTVSATGLVHEAYLKLVDGGDWTDRAHFSAVASRAMRQILTDRARARNAEKRGGPDRAITLDADLDAPSGSVQDRVLEVDLALDRLAEREPGLARLVEMRFFGGMTMTDIAEVTGVTRRTATRDWARAKAYLHTLLA